MSVAAQLGYHEHASGLLVPDDLARTRQVWTRDEWRLLERATKLLNGKKIQLLMRCQNESCKDEPLQASRKVDGSFQLRCHCTDRVMTKAF